jgi:putative hemin transport protein
MPAVSELGEVMALTRNESAVHERVGTYGEYHSGPHASMVLGKEIDLRIFAKHWVHGYAVEVETEKGVQRSLQVFDAAGDAVHKVFLREASNLDKWDDVRRGLEFTDSSASLSVKPRKSTEAAKANPEKRDLLLQEWGRMTDTHQFMRLTSKLGINRLGAYRMIEGTPWVRKLAPQAVDGLLQATSAASQDVILFVGNPGNIQIHWGGLQNIRPMGPWFNVLDERFNLHLRGDHVAEVYAIEKPTKRGAAISLEAFDKDGMLIAQVFGQRHPKTNDLSTWMEIMGNLPSQSAAGEQA